MTTHIPKELPPTPAQQTKEVTRGEQKTEDGRTTISYDVSIGGRSFKVTVGFSQEYLEQLIGSNEQEENDIANVIDKIVNQLRANDIIELSGHQITTNLNDKSQTTVRYEGKTKSLNELANGNR